MLDIASFDQGIRHLRAEPLSCPWNLTVLFDAVSATLNTIPLP